MISKNEVLQALHTLPKGLDNTYDQALERIQEQPEWRKVPAIKALTWLSLSFRPLSLTEMQHALSTKPSHRRFDKDNLIPVARNLALACAGLVTIDTPGDKVSLTHYTTREYLVRHLDQLLPRPHHEMAKVCLTYLSFQDFDRTKDRNLILQDQPFAAYASRYWGYHAQEAGDLDSDAHSLALKLLQRDLRTTDTFILEPTDRDSSKTDLYRGYISRDRPDGLHLAAHFGLQSIALELLEGGIDINSQDAHGNTAIHYAAWQGQNATIQFLVDSGAHLSLKNYGGAAPLHCAAVSGRRDTAALLLACGADINDNPPDLHVTFPPLHEAILYDQAEMVEELLRLGADKELISSKLEVSPLNLACIYLRARPLSALLQYSPSIEGEKGRQALSKAMKEHYFDDTAQYRDTIETLAASNIDLDQPLKGGHSALDLALQLSHGAVIEILLDADAHTQLAWYRDQPAIQKWMDWDWFPKLAGRCANGTASTISSGELQPTSFTRSRNVAGVFSWTENCYHTSGLYFPQPRPLFYADIRDLTTDYLWSKFQPYISMNVPENFLRVNNVIITTESHDQGPISLPLPLDGILTVNRLL